MTKPLFGVPWPDEELLVAHGMYRGGPKLEDAEMNFWYLDHHGNVFKNGARPIDPRHQW